MNSQTSYDSPTREVYLLENVPIQGRRTELRQLMKLLNLAKTGQPKAALITGDAGIGKTALMDAFLGLVAEGMYCRVLNLGKMTLTSPEAVYVALIEKLRAEADDILDEALIAVNQITRDLDLSWDRQDLIRAISLVKLQESIGGKDAISQEQLVKAIRSQVPAVKKLKFSVNESIEKLVDLIVNPWVMVATTLLNPMSPPLQEAMQLAESLRANDFKLPQDLKLTNLLKDPAPKATAHALDEVLHVSPVRPVRPQAAPSEESALSAREALPPLSDLEALAGEETGKPARPKQVIVDDELNMLLEEGLRAPGEKEFHPTAIAPLTGDSGYQASTTSTPVSAYSGAGSSLRMESALKPMRDPLVRHLMTVFNFLNSAIENIDSGFLIVVDEWDRIQQSPRAYELKEFFSELLYQITEQKNYHFMVVMTARTEGESYTLGGALYNHFRTKLLLDALGEPACRKLLRPVLKEAGADLDEDVKQKVFELSRGNPFWHLKMMQYLKERVESNRLHHVDMAFFDKLGLEDAKNEPHKLFELAFTRLKLTFMKDEPALYKVIATLLKQFGENSFPAGRAIREISASQGFAEDYVFEVLRALFRHDFLHPVETPPKTAAQAGQTDAYYTVQSRYALTFLTEKTRTIETDISTDEKIQYLKKIIPLSIKSGELDREKTLEVLSLGDALGNSHLVEFLEGVFLEALQDEKAVVRVTVLNNIALIDSERAREAVFKAMRDENSMVREYAARNLALLAQKSEDAGLNARILDLMMQSIDDESEAVRAQVYATLSKYRWHRDMTTVFVKGMSDACDSVRLTSIRNLAEMESSSPYLFNTLLDALGDKVSEVRRQACIGLQKYPNPEVIDAIVKMLQTDADSGIRALAADTLSVMDDPKAFLALVTALRNEASEDVKLAVVRALGKRRGWQTEAVLQEAVQSAHWESMPVYTWACVRSLGQVAGTERSRELLMQLKQKVTNNIILNALNTAIRKIGERIQELRQMERQLEEATPVTVAVPPEYDEEVTVPEEDPVEAEPTREEAYGLSDPALEMPDVTPEDAYLAAETDDFEPLPPLAPSSHHRSERWESLPSAEFADRETGIRGDDLPWLTIPKPSVAQSARSKALLKLPFEKN